MESKHVYYTKGYKYRVQETIITETRLRPAREIAGPGMILTREGTFIILPGYPSDGPSGITIDTKTFMKGAFVHDGGYHMLRQDSVTGIRVDIVDDDGTVIVKNANFERIREEFDIILYNLNEKSGMIEFRNKYVFAGVRKFGRSSAECKRKIHKAP